MKRFDCPNCGAKDSVILKDGEEEAYCEQCHQVFAVEPDEEDTETQESVKETKEEISTLEIPDLPSTEQEVEEVASPPPAVEEKPKRRRSAKKEVKEEGDKFPNYVKKSRPWKWAKELGKTGNPFREGTKYWRIFDVINSGPSDIVEIVKKCVDLGLDEQGFLLSLHEVLMQCVAAGLIKQDSATKKYWVP